MIVNEEDSDRLVRDRMIALNMQDPELDIYYRIARGSKLTKSFVKDLIAEAKEKDIGVIMFDSLRSVHEADENDSTGMQAVMDLFKEITRENITVIFTHHNRKKSKFDKGDSAESTRGSSSINAAVSGHISLEQLDKDGDKVLVVRHLKSKVGEKLSPFDLTIEVEGATVSFHYMGDHKEKEQALSQAREGILSELQDRSELMGRKDFLYLKIGGQTTIKDATKSLVKDGSIQVITRKEATAKKMHMFSSEGKNNEKLYFIEKEDVEMDDLWAEIDAS
jgi:RecA-family ATPase